MPPRNELQDYSAWISAVSLLWEKGWKNAHRENRWIFRAPSGSLHDLGAADLSQLERIEREGIFKIN